MVVVYWVRCRQIANIPTTLLHSLSFLLLIFKFEFGYFSGPHRSLPRTAAVYLGNRHHVTSRRNLFFVFSMFSDISILSTIDSFLWLHIQHCLHLRPNIRSRHTEQAWWTVAFPLELGRKQISPWRSVIIWVGRRYRKTTTGKRYIWVC